MTRLLHRLQSLSGRLLRLIFLLLILDIGLLALLTPSDQLAEPLFRTGFSLMVLALLVWGGLSLPMLISRRSDLGDALRVVPALLFGGIGLQVVSRDIQGMVWPGLAALLYLLLGLGLHLWSRRGSGRQTERSAAREQDNDPGIRGSVSIFMTGSDSYKLVRRHPDPGTEASRFQARLLRYIEKKTGRRLLAFSGDGCDYWRVPSELSQIELMVIGPGFNTRTPPAADNPWILRIRETEPYRFTGWINEHFPEGCAVVRHLPGGKRQTQFSARCLKEPAEFFRQQVEAPDLDQLESLGLTPSQAAGLLDLLERLKREETGEDEASGRPRHLH
jgi:hypothetical protein